MPEEIISIRITGDTSDIEGASKRVDLALAAIESTISRTQLRLNSFQSTLSNFGNNAGVIAQNSKQIVEALKNIAEGGNKLNIKPIRITADIERVVLPKIDIPQIKIPVEVEQINFDTKIPPIHVEVEAGTFTIPEPTIPHVEIPIDADTSRIIQKIDSATEVPPIDVLFEVTNADQLANQIEKATEVEPVQVTTTVDTKAVREGIEQATQVEPVQISVEDTQLQARAKEIDEQFRLKKYEIPVTAKVNTQEVQQKLSEASKPVKVQVDTTQAELGVRTLANTIETLEAKLGARKEFIRIETDSSKLAAANKEMEGLGKEIARLKNIGKSGFDALGNGVDKFGNKMDQVARKNSAATQNLVNFSRIIQDIPYGIQGIANNLNPMVESFQRGSTASGGFGAALKGMAAGLIGPAGIGITIAAASSFLISFGDKLFKTASAAELNAKKIKEAKQALEDYASGLDDITGSSLRGSQNAQEQLVQLQTLYSASQNANIPLAKRKEIIDELQSQYPKYFKNISDETILAGGAEKAYQNLTTAILASARARAAQESLVDIQKQILTYEQQVADAMTTQTQGVRKLAELRGKGAQFVTTSATGEERLSKAGAQANEIQNKINEAVEKGNEAYRQKNELLKRAQLLSDDIKTIVQQTPDALTNPLGNLKDIKEPDLKFNFFDKFFKADPKTAADKAKQVMDMAQAAIEFATKNREILVGVDDILKFQGNDEKVVQEGKKFWDNYQKGIIKFKPPKIELGEIIMPTLDVPDFSRLFVSSFEASGIESVNLKGIFDIPDKSDILDKYADAFAKIGQQLPKIIQIKDAFGRDFQINVKSIVNTADLENGLKKAFDEAKKRMADLGSALETTLQSISAESFSTIGEAISSAISGEGISDAFAQLGNFLGGALAKLGAQMIALSPIIQSIKIAIKSLNPALLLPAGIALVAIGNLIKSNFAAIPFSKGGKVPGSGSRDTVPALLTPGEIVLTVQQAREYEKANKSGVLGLDSTKFTNAVKSFKSNISTQLSSLGSFGTFKVDSLLKNMKLPDFKGMQTAPAPININGNLRLRGADAIMQFHRENKKQGRGG